MDLEYKSGLMEPGTRGTGNIIRHVVKANSGMSMVMCLRASGMTTRPTATECMFI
jgi:hypothetical protein